MTQGLLYITSLQSQFPFSNRSHLCSQRITSISRETTKTQLLASNTPVAIPPKNHDLDPRPRNPTAQLQQLQPPPLTTTLRTLALTLLLAIFLSYTMPFSFLTRFTRPFTSTTMSLAANSSTGAALPPGAQKATIAAGCFWGVEHLYRKHFAQKGLIDARVGYIGGDLSNPTYRAVCGGDTGHAEALQVVYDPAQVSYRALLEFFYRMHDPTTANRQGPDTGPQYRSAIFYHDDEQRKTAEEVTKLANEQWYKGKIVTEVIPAGQWWDAEQYHQLYLHNNPSGYECPSHFLRTFPELQG